LTGAPTEPRWVDVSLSVGDEVLFRVLEAAEADPPEQVRSLWSEQRPGDRRSEPRFDIFVNFVLRRIGPSGEILEEGRTIAENVSRGGTRVMTMLSSLGRGDVVHLEEVDGSFKSQAEVRGTYVGEDGI
jgi:hypothetical protein